MPTQLATERKQGTRLTAEGVLLWVLMGGFAFLAAIGVRGNFGLGFDLHAFYMAGALLRTNPAHLYDVGTQMAYQSAQGWHLTNTCLYYHPSYEALLYAPLSVLPYGVAYFVYMAWNLLLLGVAAWLAPRGASVGKHTVPLLLFTGFPVLLCLLEGQNSILFLVAVCCVWRHLDAGEDWRAGAVLGMALFKPALAVPLALLLTVKLGKRFLAGFAATGSAVMLLSVWLTGWEGMREFLRLASRASPLLDAASNATRAISVYRNEMPNLEGLLYLGGGRLLTEHGQAILSVAGTVLLLVVAAAVVRRAPRETAFCLAITFAVLLSHHLFLYDHAALLLPMLFLTAPGTRYLRAAAQMFPYAVFAALGLRFAMAGLIPLALAGWYGWKAMKEAGDSATARWRDAGWKPMTEAAAGSRLLRDGKAVYAWWVVLWLCMTAVGVAGSRDMATRTDFRAFYGAGRLVREAPARLYDLGYQREVQEREVARRSLFMPFYHPAYEALLYALPALLSFRVAYVVYLELQLGLVLLLRGMAPEAASGAIRPWMETVLFFFSAPVLLTMVYGQDSMLFLGLLLGALLALEKDNAVAAGMVLGVGMFRPQLALPIVVLMSLRAGWKLVAGFAGLAGVLAAISAWVAGWQTMLGFVRLMTRATVAVNGDAGLQRAMVVYPATMPNVHGMVYLLGAYGAGNGVGDAVTAVVSVAAFVAGAAAVRRATDVRAALGIAVLTAMLVSYHLHLYEFCLLLLPMVVLRGEKFGWMVAGMFVAPFVLVMVASTHLAVAGVLLAAFFGYAVWQVLGRRPRVRARVGELAAT